jgi:hypothetical protein
MRVLQIKKTIYPNGRVYNYKNGALQGKVKKLETTGYNNWINYINKLLQTF